MIVIEKVANNYAAYAPDLPGCVATAETCARVIELMREGIAFHHERPREDGEPVLRPQATVVHVDVAQAVGA